MTKLQRISQILPTTQRLQITTPHFSQGCRQVPTNHQSKREAAKNFKSWWSKLSQREVTIFSDGSEQWLQGIKHVTYGFVIYQGTTKVHTGQGSLHQDSHVFDAEAVGAWEGLRTAINNPQLRQLKIWLCIDSTSVIWCLRGNASQTSQWAFLRAQEVIDTWNVHVKWCPGHTDIQGNEEANQLTDNEAHNPTIHHSTASRPTISGIRSLAKKLLQTLEQE